MWWCVVLPNPSGPDHVYGPFRWRYEAEKVQSYIGGDIRMLETPPCAQ